MNVFPLCYFPPIPWFVAALQEEAEINLELWQHFRKQQFTNRMHIRVANRVLPLTIPIERRSTKAPLRDKRISYAENWQKQHWRSLTAAYRNSPYFLYYEADLAPFYHQSYPYLWEYLLDILQLLFKCLGEARPLCLTESYRDSDAYRPDYRRAFDPSLRSFPSWFMPQPYPQVFEGFQPGLSILDLLCNEGPRSRMVLQASWRTPKEASPNKHSEEEGG